MPQKINFRLNELAHSNFYHGYYKKIRVMFTDESLFGRITNVKSCWCKKGIRLTVSSLKVREFVYAYGAVDPVNGDSAFIVAGGCNTARTNEFLKVLSNKFPNDYILLCVDNASWHKSNELKIPDNIELFFIPSCTPEMNPIEQIWEEFKEKYFDNHFFSTLKKVTDKLCEVMCNLTSETVKSITHRQWLMSIV